MKGDVIWWTADFCMAHLETDDEIAASDCIAAEMAQHSGSPCTAKTHYKQQLCRLAIARGTLQSSVEKCVADPLFHGSTVRDRGVGR